MIFLCCNLKLRSKSVSSEQSNSVLRLKAGVCACLKNYSTHNIPSQ